MPVTTSDAVGQFAAEAARFRDWARDGTDSGELAVRQALIHIGALYFAALQLPPEWSDELADAPDTESIPNQAMERTADRCTLRFEMTKTLSLRATRGSVRRRSSCSR
jgi:hypothetical protein